MKPFLSVCGPNEARAPFDGTVSSMARLHDWEVGSEWDSSDVVSEAARHAWEVSESEAEDLPDRDPSDSEAGDSASSGDLDLDDVDYDEEFLNL